MNKKFLKKLRSAVRQVLAHLPMRGLEGTNKVVMVPDYARGLQTNGLPHMVPWEVTGTLANVPNTQRGMYRRMKKQQARPSI